jgi:hypothetical protein
MLPEAERIQKRYPPDDPREWLNRARSNLLQASMPSRQQKKRLKPY